jgi:Glycosyltransferase Family 4
MRRALLISYVFPPESPTGALRAGYLARYLPEFGWDVTVLTHSVLAPPFQAELVRPARGWRALEAVPFRVRDALYLPDPTAAWSLPAIAAGRRELSRRRYEAIISTAHPPSVHLVAWALTKSSGLPWIADYRDPWSGSYRRRNPVRASLDRFIERTVIRSASQLTAINDTIAGHLRELHGRNGSVFTFPNAYDPSNWDGIPDEPVAAFELCHTGRMYDERYRPQVLFEAIAQLRAANDPAGLSVKIHFYGPPSRAVDEQSRRFGVEDAIVQHGVVPREHAMRAQRRSAGLLIFQPMDPQSRTEMGSKYLEYLGARRHVLAIGPEGGIMQRFLRDHELGFFATDAVQARYAVRALYERFSNGSYVAAPRMHDILTARDLAQQFASSLDALTAKHPAYEAAMGRA